MATEDTESPLHLQSGCYICLVVFHASLADEKLAILELAAGRSAVYHVDVGVFLGRPGMRASQIIATPAAENFPLISIWQKQSRSSLEFLNDASTAEVSEIYPSLVCQMRLVVVPRL
jgi:hypothetical protein